MAKEIKKYLIQIGFGSVVYAGLFILLQFYELVENLEMALFFIAYMIIGYSVLEKFEENCLKLKIFSEDVLIVIATIGTFVVGRYQEGVMVLLLYQIGRLFEAMAVSRSHKSIAELMDIRTDVAHRKLKGEETLVDPKTLRVGNVIVIKPGEKIPIDAVIMSGKSNVDMKALTGETMPKVVLAGDRLYSGSINLTGVLEARVARLYQNSTVSKICTLVDHAIEQKAETENYLSRFARIYTPLIILMAILIAVVPQFTFAPDGGMIWAYRSLTFLIIACPSTLVVSVPIAFYGGLRAASKLGVLVKGSNYLEVLAKVDTYVFDKTGTLTKGIFEIKEVSPVGMTEEELLTYAALGEGYSNHPIALSIRKYFGVAIDKKRIKQVKEIVGLGVRAVVDDKMMYIGNDKLMRREGIPFKKIETAGTVAHIAIAGKYSGYIRISDSVRADAKETMVCLKKHFMSTLVMLTGDIQIEADAVAEELGVDFAYANLLPEEKVNYLEDFLASQREHEKLAYIGEGINDAPVLARADVGIAMGGLGSDAAIEAADVILMDDELHKIISVVKIARETLKVVRKNTQYMIFMKAIVVILATVGYITMWEAVAADIGVMVITILNSLWVSKYS